MILIGDDYACLFDYVDERVGGKQVNDVLIADQHEVTLVFENGATMPLLCACCGDPLRSDNAELSLKSISGKYLVALDYGENDEGDKALVLIFNKKRNAKPANKRNETLPVHVQSAVGLTPARTLGTDD